MFERERCLKEISDKLAYLETVIEFRNEAGFYDLNIVSETFYADLINLIYGFSLINANNGHKNTPAIDLIDKNNEISIQVTSDSSSEKIKHTIDEFIKNKLYKGFKRLIIFHIKGSKSYRTVFDTKDKFEFSAIDDIWNSKTLINQAKNLDISKLKKICEFFQSELKEELSSKMPEASEVETVIDLIEFITSNRQTKYRKINSIIDPDYKINKRFKDFANTLKAQYESLLPIYGTAMDDIEKERESDDAQEIITVLYLQDISIKILDKCQNSPVKALGELVDFFEDKLKANNKKYDRAAIKFYLIRHMIKCNVFPNEVNDEN